MLLCLGHLLLRREGGWKFFIRWPVDLNYFPRFLLFASSIFIFILFFFLLLCLLQRFFRVPNVLTNFLFLLLLHLSLIHLLPFFTQHSMCPWMCVYSLNTLGPLAQLKFDAIRYSQSIHPLIHPSIRICNSRQIKTSSSSQTNGSLLNSWCPCYTSVELTFCPKFCVST